MRIIMIFTLLIPGYLVAGTKKPMNDSTKYRKTLIWQPDRSQSSPTWQVDKSDFSFYFNHLKESTELQQDGVMPTPDGHDKSLESHEEIH